MVKKPAKAAPVAVVDYEDEDEDAMEVPDVQEIFSNRVVPQRKTSFTLAEIRDGAEIPGAVGTIGAMSLADCRRLERETKPGKRKPIEI